MPPQREIDILLRPGHCEAHFPVLSVASCNAIRILYQRLVNHCTAMIAAVLWLNLETKKNVSEVA